jgi:hypothetical protein
VSSPPVAVAPVMQQPARTSIQRSPADFAAVESPISTAAHQAARSPRRQRVRPRGNRAGSISISMR